ncbi:MAG: phosphatase PAP2 family protein [Firmicutes bacterium]|nr:phosphatase PAP2 family protein [Bacillota bacterium]
MKLETGFRFRQPVVDYRSFRLSRIHDPQFAHLKLLAGWAVYFALFFLTENLIPPEACHVVHCRLDDLIPFCEWFLIPYSGWYVLIVVSLVWFGLYDIDSFKRLSVYIMITQAVAMVAYIFWPSIQLLRPEVFPRQNILTEAIGLLYAFDTNTGVCPSLHVAYSVGIASTWLKKRDASVWTKSFVVIFVVLVILSTMFIKQHSAMDAFAAIPVCMLAEWVVFRDWWKEH